mmetsp:Transcript_21932/g.54286  ORF Transcript_21932/g.54286 Transcript_21932/m.54286 type:complete len:258 (+) Transcript_21932:139-912(+)
MSNSNDTSSSLLRLVGRKHKAKLGADLNESVATGPNAFARAQLEKLGWKEGTGLGKNRDGRSEHIRVTKRREGQAIGAASTEIDPVVTGDQWWKGTVGNTLARLTAAKKQKKSKKSKKEKKKRKLEYTDEELFEATGGARFGMRAQTQQKGKWNRAEDAITKDEEEEAKSKTEWDGMAAPKIILSSEAKKDKKSETAIDEESSSSSASSKLPKRKKRKISSEKDSESKPKTEKPKKEKKSKKAKKDKKGKEKKKCSR